MAEMKVSEMIEAEQVNDEDLIMIVQNGVNKKVPASKVGTGQAGGDTLPIGAIIPFSSDTIPENWLLCDGQAVSRTTYQELFSSIGTTYGNGDGSTTFNLPNLQGKIPVGKDENDTDFDTLGNTGGEKEHTLTTNEMPSHNHQSSNYFEGSGGTSGVWAVRSLADLTGYNDVSSQTGGNQAHNNVQPYIVQNYIIKAKQSAGVVATVVDGLNSTSATNALSANQGKILNEKIEKNIVTGVEIETSQSLDGNKIYLKRIDCGTISEGDGTTTSTGLSNVIYTGIDGGFVYTDTNGDANYVPVNMYFNSNLIVGAFVQNNNIRVYATAIGNRTGRVYCNVYYVKKP